MDDKRKHENKSDTIDLEQASGAGIRSRLTQHAITDEEHRPSGIQHPVDRPGIINPEI